MAYEDIQDKGLFAPIPLEIPPVAGWKELPVQENGEPLVAVGSFAGNAADRIFTSSIYYGERNDSPYGREALAGSLVTTFVRREAARQLLEVEAIMPKGLHVILLDTYRSLDVQQSLYDQYASGLRHQHPEWSEEQVSAETQKFVSLPSTDPTRPSPHNTGGSVDLAIYRLPDEVDNRVAEINRQIQELDITGSSDDIYKLEMERIGLIAQNAELLDFGTQFDYGGPEAALNYLEVLETQRQLLPAEETARTNRRLLYNAMMKAGFEPYADEWWHYNSAKSQMGAKTAGLPVAEYGAIQLSPQNLAHEQMRKDHIRGTEIISQLSQTKLGHQLEGFNAAGRLAREGAIKLGDYRKTNLPEAAIIEPPDGLAA